MERDRPDREAVDEDRLTPELGRLIDAAKAAAGEVIAAASGEDQAAAPCAEGWAWLGANKAVYAGRDPATALAAARTAGAEPLAAAFAVVGDPADTLLPHGDWRGAMSDVDPETPIVVKYLGRWVMVTLAEVDAI